MIELIYLIKRNSLKVLKNSSKKILIAHSSNDKYGASKVLVSIVDIFIKNGFDIYLFLPHGGPLSSNEILKKTNLKIMNLGVFRKKYYTVFGLINRLFFIIKSSLYMKNFIKKNQIDLVYTNTSTLISSSIAGNIAGISSIHHIHEIPNNKLYVKFLVMFLNYFSKNIICVSKSVSDFWVKNGLNKDKVKIIYNGFNFKKLKPKKIISDKIVFTSISRIIPYKGHSILIKIFDKICKKNSRIYLQIVGDTLPQYEKYLNKLQLDVKSRGLDNKIDFIGFRDDIMPILKRSNFFIHTPLFPDPFPTVIFEAIESRTPVITNKQGGAYEILNNGKNGLIINNDLIEDSVNKVLDFIYNKEEQLGNVESAFNYASKNFSFNSFETNILGTIE